MRKEVKEYIHKWKQVYKEIPDEVPKRLDQLNKAPSYKRVCLAILKNDVSLLGMKRKKSKYYDILKKIELKEKGKLRQKEIFSETIHRY